MVDLLVYLYFIILFVLGLGSTIWIMIFYHKKTDAIIAELKRNGETEIAEKIERVVNIQGSRLPSRSSFSRENRLLQAAWNEFRRADLSNKSKFLVKTQRLYRFLNYIYWFVLVLFAIPFALIVILIIVSIF